MIYRISLIGTVLLTSFVLTLSAAATTDVYLAVDDGGVTFPDGRLFHYTYDSAASPNPTYTLFGQSPLGAGTTIHSLAVNTDPGPNGGIYAAMTGNFNQLAEYSFNRGSGVFTSERAISGVYSEVAVDGLDRIYAVETATTGLLHNYVPDNGSFTSNASTGATDPGGSAQLSVLLNNNIAVSGETSTGAVTMSQQYSVSGSSFTLTGSNHNGALIPNDLATSPLDGKLWYANKNIPLGSGFNSLYELLVPLTDGGFFGFDDFGQTIKFTDIDVLSNGRVIATGESDFFEVQPGEDPLQQYLLAINPEDANATALQRISLDGPSPTVLYVDHEDTIHVATMGQLTSWTLGPHPTLPAPAQAFTARAQIHAVGDLGNATAIVTADAPAVTNVFGDFNADGVVNAADYPLWRKFLGHPDETPINNNGDGANGVDEGDYFLWRASFGEPGSGGAGSGQVPEPSTVGLVILGLSTLLCRVPRRRNSSATGA